MAGANNFLAVGTGGSANVLTQSAYAALSSFLSNGFTSGIVSSAQINKLLRQTSFVAAAMGQIIANNNVDALDDGNLSTFVANLLNGIHGRLIGVQVFTATGTYTPTTGTSSVVVECQAGGGAGGGAPATNAGGVSVGGGGGAGARGVGRYTTGFSGVTVTVGAGGTGVSGGAGNNGGTSSFGALLSCPGGNGGGVSGPTTAPWGQGGGAKTSAPSGTTIVAAPGAPGGIAVGLSNGAGYGGLGGSTVYGAGGEHPGQSLGGIAAGGKGAGGSGTCQAPSSAALTGGAGAAGIVIVWEFS